MQYVFFILTIILYVIIKTTTGLGGLVGGAIAGGLAGLLSYGVDKLFKKNKLKKPEKSDIPTEQ